jgi:hypothetical protein
MTERFKTTTEGCKQLLGYFISYETPGLSRFYPPGVPKFNAASGKAAKMIEALVNDEGCAIELAFKFMVLTFYGLTILLSYNPQFLIKLYTYVSNRRQYFHGGRTEWESFEALKNCYDASIQCRKTPSGTRTVSTPPTTHHTTF